MIPILRCASSLPNNGQVSRFDEMLQISRLADDVVILPYIIAKGNPTNVSADLANMYTTFPKLNSDGAKHIKLLANNVFGFEDLAGGGDNDFDDVIVRIDSVF